jgi:GTP-binding protein
MRKKIITLVGRPNVGKSTLFNRLSLRTRAIVHNKAGVTRDRKYGDSAIGGFEFISVDTPGLEEAEEGKLEQRMMTQTIIAIGEADLVCLIVDHKDSVTPYDKFFANLIKKYNRNYILIVNKCESRFDFDQQYYKLGFGDPVAISAQHGIGMIDLYDAIISKIEYENVEHSILDPIKSECLQIVVSGRPNAGKSTFINALIHDNNRLLTGPEAGITRESIAIDWDYKGHKLKLIDSAGLRKKNAISEELEKLSASDAINSVKFANVVILMLDAQNPLEQQDLNIANYVINEGRGLVIVINKWDLIKNKTQFQEELNYKLETHLPQVKGIAIIFISALHNQQVDMVLDEAIKLYNLWNKKIPTSKLNQWLGYVTESHPLPLQKHGKRVRIKYMTQIKNRPPTFKLFSNNPDKITDSYIKYLINDLRNAFTLPGVPIRFYFSKTDNPFVKNK